jgi:hypothetical protein
LLICSACGNRIPARERYCGVCGKEVVASAATFQDLVAPVANGPAETSSKAIASLVCGLFVFFFPISIVAIILGHLSLSDIRRSAGRLKGDGLAIAGLVLGYLGLGLIAAILIVAAVWLPRTFRAQRTAATRSNETSPVAVVRTLNTAEIAYAQAHPAAGYTCSLDELKGTWGISSDVAHGKKNGYTFVLQQCTANKTGGPFVKYQVVAYPPAGDQAGKPTFCSNESDVIKVSRSGSPQDCLTAGVDLSVSEINHPQDWSQASPR